MAVGRQRTTLWFVGHKKGGHGSPLPPSFLHLRLRSVCWGQVSAHRLSPGVLGAPHSAVRSLHTCICIPGSHPSTCSRDA